MTNKKQYYPWNCSREQMMAGAHKINATCPICGQEGKILMGYLDRKCLSCGTLYNNWDESEIKKLRERYEKESKISK